MERGTKRIAGLIGDRSFDIASRFRIVSVHRSDVEASNQGSCFRYFGNITLWELLAPVATFLVRDQVRFQA